MSTIPTAQMLPMLADPRSHLGSVLVASIFPIDRKLTKHGFYPKNTWVTPLVKKGDKPFILPIETMTENVFMGGATNQNPRGTVIPKQIPATQIADDFCHDNFIIGKSKGGQPGLWVVGSLDTQVARDISALQAELTPLELEQVEHARQGEIKREIAFLESRRFQAEHDHMRSLQDAFFEEWVHHAERLTVQGKRDQIIDMHRIAAEWHGIKGRSWQRELAKEQMNQCRYCTEWVSAQAVVCPHCQKIVDAERYAAMQAEEKELIRRREAELRERNKELDRVAADTRKKERQQLEPDAEPEPIVAL